MLLVYSTDLPQVTELEQYRPSTITELYDDQNRVIGQFALQRRVIDKYDDFPKVLRDATHLHRRQRFRTALGRGRVARVWRSLARCRGWRPRAGRFDAHHATVAQPVSLARPQLPAQDAGGDAGHPD